MEPVKIPQLSISGYRVRKTLDGGHFSHDVGQMAEDHENANQATEHVNLGSPKANIGPWWMLPLLLFLVLVGILAIRFTFQPVVTVVESSDKTIETLEVSPASNFVSLEIDFGEGRATDYQKVSWSQGMSVLDLLTSVANHSEGFTFSTRGTGASTFLVSLGGVENDATSGRFWQYWVNDQRADRSLAIFPLQPDDNVLWRFASQD